MLNNFSIFDQSLEAIKKPKVLISTINAHSFNLVFQDSDFQRALLRSDVLLPDGIGVVLALRFLKGIKIKKIAGADLFAYEMERLNAKGGKCFFLGSTESTLSMITQKSLIQYPNVQVSTYSPPYKEFFSADDNDAMVNAINSVEPDVLFIGMTAPKQEKWAYQNFDRLKVGHVCCIGAVFDFYAGTVSRAPGWLISMGLEWLYRLVKEPRRLWRRYLIGNSKFLAAILYEKYILNQYPVLDDLESLNRLA